LSPSTSHRALVLDAGISKCQGYLLLTGVASSRRGPAGNEHSVADLITADAELLLAARSLSF
jgi:hypothetical protein